VLFLFLKAYWNLVRFDRLLAANNFPALYSRIRDCPSRVRGRILSPAQICAAVDYACIWYWKDVLCLQRSVTTAWLLRQNAFNAVIVIGTQFTPFRSHAWVELDGKVLNDKPHVTATYDVLDRWQRQRGHL
jgi:hypothetical protein